MTDDHTATTGTDRNHSPFDNNGSTHRRQPMSLPNKRRRIHVHVEEERGEGHGSDLEGSIISISTLIRIQAFD